MFTAQIVSDSPLPEMYQAAGAPFGADDAGLRRWSAVRHAVTTCLARRGVTLDRLRFEQLVDVAVAEVVQRTAVLS